MSNTEAEKPLTIAERLRYIGEAIPFFLFMGFFRLLGIDAASALGGFIGREIFYRVTPVMDRARENLCAAYPGMQPAEREKIIREMCDNLGRTVAEYPHLDKLKITGPNPRLEIAGKDIADAEIARGKGVMFISGHFANWEAMPVMATQLGYDGGLVYRPPNNPYVDNYISRMRASAGPKVQIGKGAQGTRKIFTMLRRGLCILPARRSEDRTRRDGALLWPSRADDTGAGSARIEARFDAATGIERALGGARFRMTVHPPIEYTPTGDHDADVQALTVKINAAMEAAVRARPSQWLWIHRRWKTARDETKNLKKS